MRIVKEGNDLYHVYVKNVDFWATRNELAAMSSRMADVLKDKTPED